ncbi:SDR family NAD(P)-dependent oxidoreductase [Falsigemmobacter faecalis]|uniref:SDR family oxidoreductase n=1 Tax=Falsigemmobacter faecalis TaxID=2488730 RepID=A0A3P3D513_9RHOB|nr:SDR family oxidoreductase [Falsigemmobacter faecalis]RRH68874.1 SDR family oxidoreductase [Falsigemmobacter faecalis]
MSGAFSGRRIVVAGGAQGIGLAIVLRLRAAGAKVGVIDLAGPALSALPGDVTALAADITDTAALAAAGAEIAASLGGVDGLVNSAGIDLVAPLSDITDDAWERIIAVNLTGAMKLARAFEPSLRASGCAAIVNLSSGAGLVPLKHRSAYSASKAGLQMFSKSLAMELAEAGIRVNCVCPGAVETPLFRASISGGEDEAAQLQAVRARYALQRIAAPDEIAAAILWLLSDEASYVTGVALAVDGGRTFH